MHVCFNSNWDNQFTERVVICITRREELSQFSMRICNFVRLLFELCRKQKKVIIYVAVV